ncbi:hypothetical protein GWK48_02865 [Metallosphaera tengchongensis]|uniref:Uncharacterized protein n=1 Tax=Metallosphaera tengchongensis TaxID=1532350 RepID=A0A6N0NRU4_9CREN|nr:hypothetical protein [Metallosphaera tengchongensis]QKQ99475.1 hypothetical protein GWK48_02865 [Metallosphaera tengchongensis]
MENFLRDPVPEEASKQLSAIYSERQTCLKGPFDPDFLIFSSLISKYFKGDIGVSFKEPCPLRAERRENGNYLVYKDAEYYLGPSSFSSLLPLTLDDLVPILSGISSDLILRRRKLTEWERKVLNNAERLNLKVEKSLRLPGYNEVPLFLSIYYSLDPFIPEISGNRENSLKLVREIGGNEFTKLGDLDEAQLNSLIFRLISSISRLNPKVTRDDLIEERFFFGNFDFLELGFLSIFLMDLYGYPGLFRLASEPSYPSEMVVVYRETLSRGLTLSLQDSKDYYLVETSLPSPTLLYLIAKQLGKIKVEKPVVAKVGDKLIPSRYFSR